MSDVWVVALEGGLTLDRSRLRVAPPEEGVDLAGMTMAWSVIISRHAPPDQVLGTFIAYLAGLPVPKGFEVHTILGPKTLPTPRTGK